MCSMKRSVPSNGRLSPSGRGAAEMCSGRRPQLDRHQCCAANCRALAAGKATSLVAQADRPNRSAVRGQLCFDNVHFRRADKAGNKGVGRLVIQRRGACRPAGSHRLSARRCARPWSWLRSGRASHRPPWPDWPDSRNVRCNSVRRTRIAARNLASRLDNGSSNKKHFRLLDDRTAHRNALGLAAGELLGVALQQMAPSPASPPLA